MLKIHFFAQLRERLGQGTINLEYAGKQTVEQVKQHLVSQGPPWDVLTENDILIAVNQTICGSDTHVHDGDEIAFFPPVTGG